MFSCCKSLRRSISRSKALSMLFLRSWLGAEPVGSSTCLTAIRRPLEASIPKYTFPNDPAPIRAPLIHLVPANVLVPPPNYEIHMHTHLLWTLPPCQVRHCHHLHASLLRPNLHLPRCHPRKRLLRAPWIHR